MSKYEKENWVNIQKDYDYGLTQYDVCLKNNISKDCLRWGIKHGVFKPRTSKESFDKSLQLGKFKKINKESFSVYKKLCSFKFNVFDFPELFDLELLKKVGYYKASNRGDNPNGLSRDHIYSIKEGYLNNVHPFIISHIMNCDLIKHTDNNRKNTKCNITLEDLKNKINNYEGFENKLLIYKDSLIIKENKNNYKFCKCGKKILKCNKTCSKCYIRVRKVENRPTREELIKLLSENSYVKVGKIYGVSDNCIRKWLK